MKINGLGLTISIIIFFLILSIIIFLIFGFILLIIPIFIVIGGLAWFSRKFKKKKKDYVDAEFKIK